MKLVRVVWEDAGSDARWSYKKDLPLVRCETVGWLVKNGGRRVVVAGERNASGHWSNKTAIPRTCVVSVTELK